MSRIYWDTMLFIYLLEDHPKYSFRVQHLLKSAHKRGDVLCTSYLALGELMAGAEKAQMSQSVKSGLQEMGFSFLSFDSKAVTPFSRLRSIEKVSAPDAIHLACAASAGVDLFLTGDQKLTKLFVPGIQFIADFNTPLL